MNWKFEPVDYYCKKEHGQPYKGLEDADGNPIIGVGTCDYMHIEDHHRQQIEHVPKMLAALKAWEKYDLAICKRAGDGELIIDPAGALAEGVDLDTLYNTAKTLMDDVLNHVKTVRD